jgi:poly-beta-1,6-N-acetyl-D-glucosamine synthase
MSGNVDVKTNENGGGDYTPRRFYLSVSGKFLISFTAAAAWFAFSMWVSNLWIDDLAAHVGLYPALAIILFIALIPGFLNIFLLVSLILDKPPALNLDIAYIPITILIAAYNEQETLPDTFKSIAESDYPEAVEIILIDDGSGDETVSVAERFGPIGLKIIRAEHGGKANALTRGLAEASHDIVLTIDADTYLHPQALRRLIARFMQEPPDTAAVAGCVLARNSRETFMTRMQEWDYFVAINSVKRQQAMYQGTLVAEGAFSAFNKRRLIKSDGWPNVIGEDIVLTWEFLAKGYTVGFEPTAIGFTNVPPKLKGFYRQRKRWARGMIEGLKLHGGVANWERLRLAQLFVAIDFLFPVIDVFFTFAFIPGVILAATGHFFIVGPMTLLVLPITFLIIVIMFAKERRIFEILDLKVRKGWVGVITYAIFYQFIMSPVCVVGYFQEIFGLAKRW